MHAFFGDAVTVLWIRDEREAGTLSTAAAASGSVTEGRAGKWQEKQQERDLFFARSRKALMKDVLWSSRAGRDGRWSGQEAGNQQVLPPLRRGRKSKQISNRSRFLSAARPLGGQARL